MADLDDYGPFDAGVGANRTEDFWRDFFRHLTGSAVIDGVTNELAVSERGAGANLSVDVATGECYVRGHWGESTSIKNLPIATADATNPRIDRVVLRLDVATNKITLEVLEGTPAGSPSAPGLTQTSATWEIPLAQVSVPAGDTTISNAQITNERGFISIGGYRFPSTTARDLYLTAPSEGDTCWVLGTYDILYEYNGSAWVVLLARGAGTPEGNVTATRGAIYERTDGSAGTTLYVKESDTTNTGWVAVSSGSSVAKAGVLVGTRGRINLIEGTNITLTVADDAGNNEVDVTVAATGSSPTKTGCQLQRSTSLAVSTATATKITWSTAVAEDDGDWWDAGSNPTRATVPASKGGLYVIAAQIMFDASDSAGTSREARLLVNNTEVERVGHPVIVSGSYNGIPLAKLVTLAAGDYVEVVAWHDAGANRNIDAAGTLNVFLTMYRIAS